MKIKLIACFIGSSLFSFSQAETVGNDSNDLKKSESPKEEIRGKIYATELRSKELIKPLTIALDLPKSDKVFSQDRTILNK